jgi:hypothetical protein
LRIIEEFLPSEASDVIKTAKKSKYKVPQELNQLMPFSLLSKQELPQPGSPVANTSAGLPGQRWGF